MSKNKKKKNSIFRKALKVILRVLLLVLLAALSVATYVVPKMSWYTEKVANKYSSKVFPKIAYIFNSYSNLAPNSYSELAVIVGVIMLIILFFYVIVAFIVKCVKRRGPFKFLYKVVAVVLTLTFVFSLLFQLMHGLNYRRTPVEEKLKLVGIDRNIDEIIEVYTWAHDEMVAAREKLGKDYNGVVHMMTSFEESAYYANILVNSASKYLGLDLSDGYVRAKPVALSHYWSYTNILGMYNPIFGEANINVDCTLPQIYAETIVHEILHAKGLARESDAELAAVMICCMADRPDFRYAGFFEIYKNLHVLLWELGYEIPFDAGAGKDYQAWLDYNDSLVSNKVTEKVAEVSEATNDNYLKSNEQEGGTETYIINNNYYVEFYYRYIHKTF